MSNSSPSNVPRHVGIILDGNRRWAKQAGLPTVEGHRRGSDIFGDIAKHLFNVGVSYVSAFVFSTENWKRTEEEVSFLMRLVIKYTEDRLNEFSDAGIRIVILGSRDRLSDKVKNAIDRVEAETQNNTKGTLALCFNYGGHEEIASAVRQLIKQNVAAADVTPERIEQALYYPEVPPVDLVIRTSGEQRLSGFMLYRAAYAELLFIEKHWPAITTDDIDKALAAYANRQRRYGA